MKANYLKIAQEIQKQGFELYAKNSTYYVNELLAILNLASTNKHIAEKDRKKYQELIRLNRFLCHLKETRVVVISDHHINLATNFDYIKRAYDFFDELDIRVVLHGGDLLHGCPHYKDLDSKFVQEICWEQLDLFSKNYPRGFQNYLVLGNHEEVFSSVGIDLIQEIPMFHEDFSVLGFGRAYLECQSYQIVLSHKVKQKLIAPLWYDCDLYLNGHSHYYQYDSEYHKIQIPTCSHILPFNSQKGKPGFLILKFEENQIISTRYCFDGEQIKRTNVERIRKK